VTSSIQASEAFSLYISDYISFKGQSAKTQEAYVCAMRELIRRFGDVDLCSLTFNDVRDWKLWLDKGRQPNTVRNYIISLRVVIKFLRQRGYGVMNAEDIPVPQRVYKKVDYLTESEMSDFIAEVGAKHRAYRQISRVRNVAIVRTLYATGLRNAELCSLDAESIKDNTFTVVGKGNKPRICFIDDETLDCIKDYLAYRTDRNPALFITLSGKRITPNDVRTMFDMIRARSERFRFVHPHTIRHSYATKLLNKRIDIRYVKEFMGHSSLETTAHYTHVVNAQLKDIYMDAHK
jgi:site-specific recombinase XerD